MYSITNFIDTTNTIPLTSTVIKLINSNNTMAHLLVTCQYQKMSLKDNNLIIVLHNYNYPLVLDFPTRQEAVTAQNLLSDLIYELRQNCKEVTGGGGGGDYNGPQTIKVNTGQPGSFSWPSSSTAFYIAPQYDISKNKIDVFLNGQKLIRETDFTISGRYIYIIETTGVNNDPVYDCGYTVCIQSTDLIEIVIH